MLFNPHIGKITIIISVKECEIRTPLANGADLDSLMNEGKYRATTDAIAQSCHNSPTRMGFILNVYDGNNSIVQQVIPFNGNFIYMRRYQKTSGTWRNWFVFTGTEVE